MLEGLKSPYFTSKLLTRLQVIQCHVEHTLGDASALCSGRSGADIKDPREELFRLPLKRGESQVVCDRDVLKRKPAGEPSSVSAEVMKWLA